MQPSKAPAMALLSSNALQSYRAPPCWVSRRTRPINPWPRGPARTRGMSTVETFLAVLASRRYADQTLLAYRRDLQALMDGLKGKPWDQVSAIDLRGLMAKDHQRGLAARSIRRRLAAWRGFFNWMGMSGITEPLQANPAQALRAPKAGRPLPKALSVDAAIAFVSSPTSLRDRAMTELVYSCGLRLSELVGLNVSALQAQDDQGYLDLQAAELVVVGKGQHGKAAIPAALAVARGALQYEQGRKPHGCGGDSNVLRLEEQGKARQGEGQGRALEHKGGGGHNARRPGSGQEAQGGIQGARGLDCQ